MLFRSISVSSTAAVKPTPGEVVYGMAKAGLHNMTESFSRAFGPEVRVNCIQPGPFLTDISKAWGGDEAIAAIDAEEVRVRRIIGDDIIFGLDDQTMETVVVDLCRQQGLSLGTAESLTGGLIAQRITAHAGVSDVFRGSIVSYADGVKQDLLALGDTAAISDEGARQMAIGAAEALQADAVVAVTGVAGPDPAGGHDVGTVFMATLLDGEVESLRVDWPFDRNRIREFTTIAVLNQLRKRLLARAGT